MEEETIEHWHHIRTCHFARTRLLRNEEMKKFYVAKHKHVTYDQIINNFISTVSNETKRQLKKKEIATIKTRNSKKNLRDAIRDQAKEEVKEEDRDVMPANRDRFKNEHRESYDV